MKTNFIAAAALAAILLGSCEQKSNEKVNKETASVNVPSGVEKMTPEQFAKKAYEGNEFEVKMGMLAVKKSTNPKVKQFAELMEKDHSKAASELKTIAMRKNIKLDSLGAEKKMKLKEFQSKSGKNFDKDYIDFMVKEHQKDIEMFQNAVNEIKDPELNKYASNTLQVIKGHYNKATELKQMLENNSASSK